MSTQLKVDHTAPSPASAGLGFEPVVAKLAIKRTGTRPEVELVLACARTIVRGENAKHIQNLLRGKLDWGYVIEQAQQHRVVPLLCQSLNEVCPELVPHDILKELRDYTLSNAHYNLYRTRALIKLLALFKGHGIPALPFKGPVLSATAYGNLALREYGDLDILVRPQDVPTTIDLLQGSGYGLAKSLKRTQTNLRFAPRNKDLIFDSADGRVRVELHWRLTGRHFSFPLDLNQLWDRLETVQLAGVAVPTLAPEDLLLYLCMHGSRHGWERVIWICDVAELVRACPTMCWETLMRQAAQLGCERMLGLGLLLASDLLGAELPAKVAQSVRRDVQLPSLVKELHDSLFRDDEASADIAYWFDVHLRVRERIQDRLRLRVYYYYRYLRLAILPNERDQAMLKLPGRLSFLNYSLRPFRLLKSFGLQRLKKLLPTKSLDQ